GGARKRAVGNPEEESRKLLSDGGGARRVMGSGVGREELKTRRDIIPAAGAERTIQPQICAVSEVVIASQVVERGREVVNHAGGSAIAIPEIPKPRERAGAWSLARIGERFGADEGVRESGHALIEQGEQAGAIAQRGDVKAAAPPALGSFSVGNAVAQIEDVSRTERQHVVDGEPAVVAREQ